MKKTLLFRAVSTIFLTLVLLTVFSVPVLAAPDINYGNSYFSYIYNFEGEPVATPAPFSATVTKTGFDFGEKPFKDIADITFNGTDKVYISDSGNNRVLVCKPDLTLIKELTSYTINGQAYSFNLPTATSAMNGKVYVADSENSRIVVFDETTLEAVDILEKPEIAALGDYVYIPMKITVDYAGRLYVIAKNVNKGLLQLNQKGEFENFLGAPKVAPTVSEIFMRKVMPARMKDKLIKNVPTEYNAINIDKDGFLFVTSQSTNIPPIAKLNGQGSNVLVSAYSSPSGDSQYRDEGGNKAETMLVDIVPRDDGGYFVLDSTRGRIFSYDRTGTMLYMFGTSGTVLGAFYSASSIEYIDGKILVADKSTGKITVFQTTEFGEAVDNAAILASLGNTEEEIKAWNNVLRLCSNYDTAHINLAKIEINDGNYASAMERLSQIGEKKNYETAFKYARTSWMKKYFYMFIAVAVAAISLIVILVKKVKKTKRIAAAENRLIGELKYSTHVIFHPFDGFWDLKREKRGSLKGALILLALFSIFYAIRSKFTGYIFMDVASKEINPLVETLYIVIPIFLWTISNWCFTTLMDGKGSIKDTFISTCYSLSPYVLFSPILFVLSHLLVGEETSFYVYFDIIIIVWVFVLLFFGMMMTHDYTLPKAFITAVLTIIGIAVILFLCLLFFNLFSEMYSYFSGIYKELSFRFY